MERSQAREAAARLTGEPQGFRPEEVVVGVLGLPPGCLGSLRAPDGLVEMTVLHAGSSRRSRSGHSPFAVRRSPLAPRPSPFTIRHSPLTTHHSPLAIRHPPFATLKKLDHRGECSGQFLVGQGGPAAWVLASRQDPHSPRDHSPLASDAQPPDLRTSQPPDLPWRPSAPSSAGLPRFASIVTMGCRQGMKSSRTGAAGARSTDPKLGRARPVRACSQSSVKPSL